MSDNGLERTNGADPYLTLEQAAGVIRELGMHASARQVKRWADERKLPFRVCGLDRKRYIRRSELVAAVEQYMRP